jgi:hypothetical protein
VKASENMKSAIESITEVVLKICRGRDNKFAIYIGDGESYDYKNVYGLILIR